RGDDSLPDHEPDGQLGILAGGRRAHRDRDALACEPQLERLLARHEVGAGSRGAVAKSYDRKSLRGPSGGRPLGQLLGSHRASDHLDLARCGSTVYFGSLADSKPALKIAQRSKAAPARIIAPPA